MVSWLRRKPHTTSISSHQNIVKSLLKHSAFGASLLLAFGAVANAAPLLVDINNSTPSPTQSGYTGLNMSNSSGFKTTFSYADTLNGSTVDFLATSLSPSTDNNRDRGTGNLGGVTNAALYRDFLFDDGNGTGVADSFDITFSGLLANQTYNFTFYSFDAGNPSNGNTNTTTLNTAGVTFASIFYNTAGATGGSGSLTNSGVPTSNSQYALTISGTTNSLGNIGFTQTGSNNAMLNGFEIAMVSTIPEPATAGALMGAGALLLVATRRKRIA